jgi:uncharacterized alpha-E superfamily protein
MLSRTADHLYWMARYIERAENTARMLNVNVETALLPQSAEQVEQGWSATLGISDLRELFEKKYGRITQRNVIDFMVRDPDNSSSIFTCLRQARENGRAVRGALTTEVWETLNATWLKLRELDENELLTSDPAKFFDWVKYRCHLSRGVIVGTMLKDEAFHFIRLGTFIERADNTARILDVKFHGVSGSADMQAASQEATQFDFYYWASILRSVSGFEIYRKVYRDVITPARVAELLILHPAMPRSLVVCMEEVVENLGQVSNELSYDTERFAGKLHAELKFGDIDEIMESGLHEYLTRFLQQTFELGNRISRDFLVPFAA